MAARTRSSVEKLAIQNRMRYRLTTPRYSHRSISLRITSGMLRSMSPTVRSTRSGATSRSDLHINLVGYHQAARGVVDHRLAR